MTDQSRKPKVALVEENMVSLGKADRCQFKLTCAENR